MTSLRRTGAAALLAALGACKSPSIPRLVDDSKDDTASFPEAEEPPPAPEAPVPAAQEKDWVKLTSGEWLRGSVIRIRGDELDFDSDKLGDVTISLDDVEVIRTVAAQSLVTEDDRILRGRVVLKGDELWIEGERTVALDRDQLFAALALNDGKAIDWSGEVTLGATARSGNTKQNDTSAYAELVRETARTNWRTTYNGVASRANGVETANNHRLRSTNNIFLTRRLFVTAPSLDVYRDRFQNIEYRVVPGAGIGYQFVDTDDHSWKLGLGPAYQYTRFDTVAPGEDDHEDFVAGVVLSEYSWDVTDAVELGLDYQINVSLEDTQDYNHNLVGRMSVDLLGDLTFDLVFVWDRVNQPNADASGDRPLADDYRTTIGLGWTF